MYQLVRELQGFSPRQSFALRLGGMRLQAPNARLCDSNAKPYSLLNLELISLCGGSKVTDEPSVKLPPIGRPETQGTEHRGRDEEDLLKQNESGIE